MRPNTGSEKTVLNPERGLTAVELLIVVGIIAIISTLAAPAVSRALAQARVAAIIADFRLVETAAEVYRAANNAWPAERNAGEVPPEMAEFLQDQIDWSAPFLYDWDNLIGPDGSPTQPESGIAVGFSVRTTDPVLLQLLQISWGGPPLGQAWGWGVTFVIEPLS